MKKTLFIALSSFILCGCFGSNPSPENNLLYTLDSFSYEATITSYNYAVTQLHIPTKIDNYVVKGIGEHAFAFQNSIKKLSFAEDSQLTRIENHAFNVCLALKEVKLPDSLEFIGEYAFQRCDSLESIVIPLSVETIERSAFWRASSSVDFGNYELKIFCEASSKPSGWSSACFNSNGSISIYWANEWEYINGVPTAIN